VIRAHALGKFSDMLRASAKHPAMLTYLNNAESTKDNPNENYGRELLELHTVGLDAGYTEDEMRTSALILTGLGVHWYDEVDDGTFHYDAENHYTGSVKVLGWSSKNASASNGLTVALDYVDYLAHHPSTARRISTKLCQRFVSDTPPAALVDEMAATYRHNDTAIAPVLRVLFNSNAFHAAKGQKVLRPMQDVISTLRILGIEPGANDGDDGTGGLYWLIESMSDAPGFVRLCCPSTCPARTAPSCRPSRSGSCSARSRPLTGTRSAGSWATLRATHSRRPPKRSGGASPIWWR
jgi:uncharacterized protein (DUF1800 family)